MDNAIAFGPTSLTMGALLPPAGRDLMVRTFGLPPGATEATEATADGWLTPEVPILVRGKVKILPLSWWGAADRPYNPYAEAGDFTNLLAGVRGAASHRAGPWTGMDLVADRSDSIGSYTAALRASGATKVDSWIYTEDAVGVTLVLAGDEQAGDRSMALQIVPTGWVFERRAGNPVDGIDVSWSWADVIELYAAR